MEGKNREKEIVDMVELNQIYQKLPIPIQNFACSLEGWRIQRTRFGRSFTDLLNNLEARLKWSKDEMEQFQAQRLQSFIEHCATSVPYYQRKFKELGIKPQDIKNRSDLSCLPILTKQEVINNLADFTSTAIPKSKQTIIQTSGSTGSGLRFATTFEAVQEQWAIWWRFRRQVGIDLGTWCGYFVGHPVVPLVQHRPPFWRYNYPGCQIFFSAYHINFENMKYYVDELRRKQPPWLHGYPSLLALLASYILETKSDLGYQVKKISIGAENLLQNQIDLMEKAFGVRPNQHYGMTEAVANISQCKKGNLHVDEDFAVAEFIADEANQRYRIVGTNLSNLATPLLRYDVNDMVNTIDHDDCNCGLPGRVVSGIDGREEDYIILKNGVRLGRLDHIFKGIPEVREAQIIQKNIGELIICVVRGIGFNDDIHEKIIYETRKRVGSEAEIIINYVDELTRSSRGKLRFVISELQSARIG